MIPQPCHSHFGCWWLPIWPYLNIWAENGSHGLCWLGWWNNGAKLSFSWSNMLISRIWNTSELSPSHLSRATAIFVLPIWPKLDVCAKNGAYGLCQLGWWYNGAKLFFSWPYMILSMIWNTFELSPLHLSRVTAIFVVDGCQFDNSGMLRLKMDIMACAGLVGGTTDQRCIFTELTCY